MESSLSFPVYHGMRQEEKACHCIYCALLVYLLREKVAFMEKVPGMCRRELGREK